MQLRVLELIPRVLHEQLTEELLLINDNLNNMFLRHERYLSSFLCFGLPQEFTPL